MSLLYLLFLFLFPLQAKQAEEGNISSLEALYEQNTLTLQGDVKLDHGLGLLFADHAVLSKQDQTAKDLPFSLIDLKENVLIDCKNNTKVSCHAASFDFSALQAALSQSVSYTSLLSSGLCLQMTSQKAFLFLTEQEAAYAIDRITATEQVTLYYGPDCTLQASKATYQSQGKICAEGDPCTLIHQGKQVHMRSIEIEPEKQLLYLQEPKGSFASSLFFSQSDSDLFFQSKELYWDQIKQQLSLKGNVLIQEEHFGTITCQEKAQIQRK
jgi:lipopolysaccharide export system protein LptA